MSNDEVIVITEDDVLKAEADKANQENQKAIEFSTTGLTKEQQRQYPQGRIASYVRSLPLFETDSSNFYSTLRNDPEMSQVTNEVPFDEGWDPRKKAEMIVDFMAHNHKLDGTSRLIQFLALQKKDVTEHPEWLDQQQLEEAVEFFNHVPDKWWGTEEK